jgi:hypothetical protein
VTEDLISLIISEAENIKNNAIEAKTVAVAEANKNYFTELDKSNKVRALAVELCSHSSEVTQENLSVEFCGGIIGEFVTQVYCQVCGEYLRNE